MSTGLELRYSMGAIGQAVLGLKQDGKNKVVNDATYRAVSVVTFLGTWAMTNQLLTRAS